MTNEQALFIITHLLKCGKLVLREDGEILSEINEQTENDALATLDKLVHATNKYRWHDLRKNPNDLPKDAETVLTYELFDTGEKAVILHKIRYFKDGVFPKASGELPNEIIAWRYIEPVEVEDD